MNEHNGVASRVHDAYDRGYSDGINDAVRVLLTPAVARAARIADADELALELGHAIAQGEATAFEWPTPPSALARLARGLGGEG
jgi:hypothetical protein